MVHTMVHKYYNPKSVHEISTIQYSNLGGNSTGLVYMYHRSSDYPFFDKDYLDHTGSNIGYGTFMLCDPHTHIGVCLLSNGDLASTIGYQRELTLVVLTHIENYLFHVFDM